MGVFRFVLALLVVVQHIAKVPLIGSSAVLAFFVLSGYLMTHVTCRSYGHGPGGVLRFWINRILRLYPGYLAIIAMSVAVLHVIGDDFAARANGALRLPENPGEWVQTLTMIYATPTPIEAVPRLSPPTWALSVELFNYLLISLGISATRNRTLLWLAAAALFQIWALTLSGNPWLWSYGSLFGGCLPFALGALVYHERARADAWVTAALRHVPAGPRIIRSPALVILAGFGGIVALWAVRRIVTAVTDMEALSMAIYLLTAVPALVALTGCLAWRPGTGRAGRIDRLAGDLSYPIYLNHWIAAMGVAWLLSTPDARMGLGPELFLASLPAVLGLGLLSVWAIDRPVGTLRDHVRPAAGLRAPPARPLRPM